VTRTDLAGSRAVGPASARLTALAIEDGRAFFLKTRVYRLARELESSVAEVLELGKDLETAPRHALSILDDDAVEAIRDARRVETAPPKEEEAPVEDFEAKEQPELRVLQAAPPKPEREAETVPAAGESSDSRSAAKERKRKQKWEALGKRSAKASAGMSARSERLLEFTRRAGYKSTSAVYSRMSPQRRQPSRGGGRKGRGDRGGGGLHQSQEEIRVASKAEITLPITVRDLSQAMGLKANVLQAKLLELGVPANVNAFLNDAETVELLGAELGCEITLKTEKAVEEVLVEQLGEDREQDRMLRAPVVTFLGHVDHGKTSLLDAIREANVTATEHGGITQHTSAYKVRTKDGKEVVFLDTPGHEAFTEMRARGAQVTDVVVLVVAADDGVMPQTEEAIKHARAAEVPIVVALNKIDKAEANPQKVLGELAQRDLQSADWGGQTSIVEVSATTGQGIDELVEILALEAEVLELRGNPKLAGTGTVLDAKLTEGRGAVVNLLVQDGTLSRGDTILCGKGFGRIRSMWDDQGQVVSEAGPSTPASITGLSVLPEAGDRFFAVKNQQEAKELAERRQRESRTRELAEKQHVTLDNLYSKIQAASVKEINIVLKADVKGSLEVLKKTLSDLSTDEIKVKVLYDMVGAITESDVNLAHTSDAIVIGFHVLADDRARSLADRLGVDVRVYHVIYDVTDEIRKAMEGLLEPEEKEEVLGHLEVRQTFKASGLGVIAGCYVTDGRIERNSRVRMFREGKQVFEGGLESLKRFKNDVREVKEGFECGLRITNFDDIKVGDVIEAYEIRKIARKLD